MWIKNDATLPYQMYLLPRNLRFPATLPYIDVSFAKEPTVPCNPFFEDVSFAEETKLMEIKRMDP